MSEVRDRYESLRHAVGIIGDAGRIGLELSRHSTPLIDQQFMTIASEVAATSPLFDLIDPILLEDGNRPDAINHDKTLLAPNAEDGTQVELILSYVDLLLGDSTEELQQSFAFQLKERHVLEKLTARKEKAGQKVIVVSNHLDLSDQGFTLGLFQKAARAQGMDRFENHATAVIGRAIGYLEFNGDNVIDGILRKAGSVLKTFPSGGKQALSDEERKLRLFRDAKNHDTKRNFGDMIHSHDGRMIFMAPSGEQDNFDRATNTVTMRRFGKGTVQMIIEASMAGAIVLPAFVDYGINDSSPSLVEFAQPVSTQKESDVHAIGEELASMGRKARKVASVEHPQVDRFATRMVYAKK